MKIDLIGFPMKYGCDVEGADLAYEHLNKMNFTEIFNKHEINNKGVIKIEENAIKHLQDQKIKYLEPIMNSSFKLYESVSQTLKNGNLPLVIGGDHATAIGSISSVLDYYKDDVTVIWIDTHADTHTEKTTPSGNVHGLPLAVCQGMCDSRFKIGNYKLSPSNLIYVGLNNFEEYEKNHIVNNKINSYYFDDIDKFGINHIFNKIVDSVKTKYVHISFDFDSLNYEDFKAVNVAKEKTYLPTKGIKLEDGYFLLAALLNKFQVTSIDMVEYNPILDNGEDLKKVMKFLDIIDKFWKNGEKS